MAASGFRRKSQNFICETPECWGVINFQKSRYSAEDEKSFTVNLAIASKSILEYYGDRTNAPPPSYACHWGEIRIGSLMPEAKDKWWRLSGEASYASIEGEVSEVLSDLAIPLIKRHVTEKGLLELWECNLPGSFEYPTLKYKSILLAQQHRFEELPEILQRIREICRGSSAGAGAEEHIAKLKEHFALPE